MPAGNRKILLLDMTDVSAPQDVAALEGHAKDISALAYSPDGACSSATVPVKHR
jgi:hypothetical protein